MHLSVPKQVYGDLISNEKNNSLIHGIVPLFGFSLAVARFFRAHLTMFALMIHEHAINVKHFFAKNRGNVDNSFYFTRFAVFCQRFSAKNREIGRISAKIRQKCLKLSLF